MNDYTSKALESWYKPDNPLYRDPRHPLIKLAGEAGELLDLYGKHEYKPNFDWWRCKVCGFEEKRHFNGHQHTPLVLDELGDWWYYLRIVAWQQDIILKPRQSWTEDMLYLLTCLSSCSTGSLVEFVHGRIIPGDYLFACYDILLAILSKLDCALDRLTDLNYRKLNSDASQHGWSEAR